MYFSESLRKKQQKPAAKFLRAARCLTVDISAGSTWNRALKQGANAVNSTSGVARSLCDLLAAETAILLNMNA